MNLEHLFRTFGRAVGEALAEGGKFEFKPDGEEGVALAELDLANARPDRLKVALSRSDVVRVITGETLAITVEGSDETKDALRFKLADGSLAIMRRRGSAGDAVIAVTMPPAARLSIAGAGTIEARELAADAELAIGGSGTIRVTALESEALTAKIAGAGRIELAGTLGSLDLSIGGSGNFSAAALEVERARVKIGGSGHIELSSDGEVEAKIGGSGDILVHGSPRCSLKASGAGRIRCVPRESPVETSEAA